MWCLCIVSMDPFSCAFLSSNKFFRHDLHQMTISFVQRYEWFSRYTVCNGVLMLATITTRCWWIWFAFCSACQIVPVMASPSSVVKRLWLYIRWLYFQYTIHLAVSTMDPWETCIFSILFIIIMHPCENLSVLPKRWLTFENVRFLKSFFTELTKLCND
jgi:hypothetical protein